MAKRRSVGVSRAKSNGNSPKIYIHEGVDKSLHTKWKRAIETAFLSVPPEVQAVVPPFYVYNTLVECLFHTFNASHPIVDETNEEFAMNKVWAFAFLQNPKSRNPEIEETDFQRIVFASSRKAPDVSPEMVIFHEIGHFHFFKNHSIPYTAENKGKVEARCNQFATQMYVRMLVLYPDYTTISDNPSIRTMEQMLKKYVALSTGRGDSEETIQTKLEGILKQVFKDDGDTSEEKITHGPREISRELYGTLSHCCKAPSRIVVSREGGFVSQDCIKCGRPRTLPFEDLPDLDCSECYEPLDKYINDRGNYAYRCDCCVNDFALCELVPHWSELFDRCGLAIDADFSTNHTSKSEHSVIYVKNVKF